MTDTKKEYPCKRCGGKLVEIPDCFDRDGIRRAGRCEDCRTVFASYAHGYSEIGSDDYDDLRDSYKFLPPQHNIDERDKQFHEAAIARGYIKKSDLPYKID